MYIILAVHSYYIISIHMVTNSKHRVTEYMDIVAILFLVRSTLKDLLQKWVILGLSFGLISYNLLRLLVFVYINYF
jgi:hypothetical protein